MGTLFGTDGIRGLANQAPLTPELALRLGQVLAQRAHSCRASTGILIGRDTRRSGEMLQSALVAGICSAGGEALLAGVIPTPAVALLVRQLGASAGIVVSASHNAFQDNGLKIFGPDGFKLADEEEDRIEEELKQPFSAPRPTGNAVGSSRGIADAGHRYLEALLQAAGRPSPLAGLRLVVDCAHGAASWVGPRLFEECGAEVQVESASPDGTNINAGCGAVHPQALQKAVVEAGATLGVALDGDADRLILVDETGSVVDGDEILALLAFRMHELGTLRGGSVVATVMSNMGLEIALRERGIGCIRTPVGDRHVVEVMRARGCSLGGEQSGHIVLLDHSTTGDGLLAALQVAALVSERGVPLGELRRCMTRLPQALVNVRVKSRVDIGELSAVQDAMRRAEEQLGDRGRLLVRYSGTEPLLRVMVEGPDPTTVKSLAEAIAEAVRSEIGA